MEIRLENERVWLACVSKGTGIFSTSEKRVIGKRERRSLVAGDVNRIGTQSRISS